MSMYKISLLKMNGVVLSSVKDSELQNESFAMTVNAEMMRLGYVMTKGLFHVLSASTLKDIKDFHDNVIPVLKHFKGDDVKHKPMYPNFPEQVMEASDFALWYNAICHYWSRGTWKPAFVKENRELAFEGVKYTEIKALTLGQYMDIFTKILGSNDSISSDDNDILNWFLRKYEDNGVSLPYPNDIPNKEVMSVIGARRALAGDDISDMVNTATDILRIAVQISGGDVSLASNTKFKSMPRRVRRSLVKALESVINEEDIKRHANKWNKLFHSLHVGEYSQKVVDIAQKVRDNKRLESVRGNVEEMLGHNDIISAAKLLTSRPGEFARSLDRLLRLSSKYGTDVVINLFEGVAHKVSTRVLMQVLGHFMVREDLDYRVVFPKGNVQRVKVIDAPQGSIATGDIADVIDVIHATLIRRFESLSSLGKIYIDPKLRKCPLPSGMRSASSGKDIVARGTRMSFGDKKALRFFIYWVGEDIDLSAVYYDKDMNNVGQVSYTNLRNGDLRACHSGDITYAPNGASEFIDIDVASAIKGGARYVTMNVFVYSGPNFSEHKACYAGWMTRDKVQSNEIYDPKTVQMKIDVITESRRTVPVMFDLVTREAIWCDVSPGSKMAMGGNNVESNMATDQIVFKEMANMTNRATLYDLFMLHATGRGELVDTPEDATTVFGWEGDVTPKDISVINSDYLI